MQTSSSPSPPHAASSARRWSPQLIVLAALAAGWIGWLAWLMLTTANPPVVNRVQILASDLVIVGRWEDRDAGRLNVMQELKHGELTGTITVAHMPRQPGSSSAAEWVVPVRRATQGYEITAGKFANRPERQGNAAVLEVDVPPQIYPATRDVLTQVEQVLVNPAHALRPH